MSKAKDLSDQFFTKELGKLMEELFLDFLNSNKDRIPKDIKIELFLKSRYGKDGFEVEFESDVKARKATEHEVRGAEVTEEDWDYIFNPDNFNTPFTKEFERLDRFYGSLRKLREEGNVPTRAIGGTGINPAFIRFNSPYRIVELLEEYQYPRSWTRSRMDTRYRRTGKYYLARLW